MMDNHISQQPNGILPRPGSQVRRPTPPTSQQQQHQNLQRVSSEQANFMDDDDEDDDEFGMKDSRPSANNPPSNRNRMSGRDPQLSRSSSRDKEVKENKNFGTPSFLKIAVIGDSTTGKTLLCSAVTNESYIFNKNYHLTCGVTVFPKSVKVPDQATGQGGGDPGVGVGSVERLSMALLDSSGKDVYLEYLPKYWDKLDGFVVVIDITNPTSLASAGDWVKLGMGCLKKKTMEGTNEILGVLIGNKMDLSERRKISSQDAQEFANKHNLAYFECSVKENSGLEDSFFYLAHKYLYTNNATSPAVHGDKDNYS